jgi:hypothetical protein
MRRTSPAGGTRLILDTRVTCVGRERVRASDRLPDLAMAKLQHIVTDNTAAGRRLLRFSAIIVNVGVGPFELRSRRTDTSSSWTARQVIYNDAGGSPP